MTDAEPGQPQTNPEKSELGGRVLDPVLGEYARKLSKEILGGAPPRSTQLPDQSVLTLSAYDGNLMPHFRLVRVTEVGGQMAEISVVYGDERYDQNHAHQYVANVMRTRAEGDAQPFGDEETYDYFETILRSARSEPTPAAIPTARKASLISRFLRRNRS